MQFTMDGFLNVFEHFIGRYRILLNSGGMDPNSPANKELEELASARVRPSLLLRNQQHHTSSSTLQYRVPEMTNRATPFCESFVRFTAITTTTTAKLVRKGFICV